MDMKDDERSENGQTTESVEERSTSIGHDQDSSVSFESDTEDNTSQAEDDEDDWIDYIKRSTKRSRRTMRTHSISCWIETPRKLKWRLAMRIASHSEQRWKKAAQRNTQERTEALEERTKMRIRSQRSYRSGRNRRIRKKKTLETTTHG